MIEKILRHLGLPIEPPMTAPAVAPAWVADALPVRLMSTWGCMRAIRPPVFVVDPLPGAAAGTQAR